MLIVVEVEKEFPVVHEPGSAQINNGPSDRTFQFIPKLEYLASHQSISDQTHPSRML